MVRSNRYFDGTQTFKPLYVYYLPQNYYNPMGYNSTTYGMMYYDGYGYNFYYKTYGYYEYSVHPENALAWYWNLFFGCCCCWFNVFVDNNEGGGAVEASGSSEVVNQKQDGDVSSDEELEQSVYVLLPQSFGMEPEPDGSFIVEDDYVWSQKAFRLPLRISC